MSAGKATRLLLAAPLAALSLAACGSGSRAPGVQLAPSAGATADTVAAAPTTSSTTSSAKTTSTASATSTAQTPLPAAFNTKPRVVVPKGPPPKHLVIRDLIRGTGPVAKPGSTVTVQYVGVLYSNGRQFDASWNDGSGKPVTLPLSGVIKGWQEGIPGMRVGGRRELIIPPSLGYGSVRQSKIPPNSTLVFVIDLHAVS
ncbi:MAG TPA: FKBP-type peptidyl-prolyl cis-trans isomerase [Solirubrobacteraceae bacterium]|nr:FKBP-type peptidyl-prolyl cis-trans isomerase [Solirubrobacteraceae bacterium]